MKIRGRHVVFGLMLLVGLTATGAGAALAHANLVRSQPAANAVLKAPPAEVRLWFSEPVEPGFSQVQLYDRTGREIAGLGALRLDPADNKQVVVSLPQAALGPSIYTVSWRVLSAADGHVTAGAFAFAVGEDQVPLSGGMRPVVARGASQTPDAGASGPTAPGVTVRWLSYLATAILVGGFGFPLLVLRPTLTSVASARRRKEAPLPFWVELAGAPGLFRTLGLAWFTSVLVALAGSVLQAATSAGVEPLAAFGAPLTTLLFTGTRYGILFWFRVSLLALTGGLLALAGRRTRRGGADPRHDTGWWRAGWALGAVILATTSLGSHSAASPDATTAIVADWIHLSAVSLWVGGLVALLITLLKLGELRSGQVGDAVNLTIARLVERFSSVALAAVVALALSGLVRSLAEVVEPANLIDTAYGQTLLFKLGLLLPLLGLAGVNLLVIRPRMQKASRAVDGAAMTPWLNLIRQTVSVEVIFVSAILLVTGILTSLPPAREAFGPGIIMRGQAADLRVIMTVDPAQAGQNTYNITLRDGGGRPFEEARKVTVTFTMIDHDMGGDEATLDNLGAGQYRGQGGHLSMLGDYMAEVRVRRPGLDDALTQFKISLLPSVAPLAGHANAGDDSGRPLRIALGVEILVAGLLLVFWAGRLGRARRWAGQLARAGGVAAAFFGVYLGGSALLTLEPTAAVKNPVPADSSSIVRGQAVYEANCQTCHGSSGRGDGPGARLLATPPANLQVHMAAGHTDGQLFEWITKGIPGSAMPPFGERLSEQERWDAINYIRTFGRIGQ